MDYFDGQSFSVYAMQNNFHGESHHYPFYYGIQYNHEGKFFLRINHKERLTAEGPYAFISHPGAYFEYGNEGSEARSHNFICAYGPRMERYLESGLLIIDDENPLCRIEKPDLFLRTMKKLIDLLRDFYPTVPPRAILLYEDLLLQMRESTHPSRQIPAFHHDFLLNLRDDIRKAPERDHNFEEEARKCSVTPTYFRRIFKQFTGFPPQQYLIECRLQKAATLLSNSGDPVSSIGEAVGIDNEFYFSRLFKKKYRISPLAFRRESSPSDGNDK